MIDDPLELIRTLVGVTALAAVATAALWAFGVPHRFAPVYAIARGAGQLAFVAAVLTGVIADVRWVAWCSWSCSALRCGPRRCGSGEESARQ